MKETSKDRGDHPRQPTRVLEAVNPPNETIRFVDQVTRRAPSDIAFSYFSWRALVLGRYDVVHFHWPEHLLRGSDRVRLLARRLLFRLFLVRARTRPMRIVRTVHNVSPHTPGDATEERLLRTLDGLVTEHVVLNGCTPVRASARTTLIRHAHYREQFADFERREATPGKLLFLGRIEAYKGLLPLMDLVSEGDLPLSHLRIVGRPVADMVDPINERLARNRGRIPISANLTYVSDPEMVSEVTSSEAVILPYSELHNSGIMLVALSLNRPIIVPRGCTTSEIADEVGAGWVIEYDDELNRETLIDALQRLRASERSVEPQLGTRDWEYVANSYADVFRQDSP